MMEYGNMHEKEQRSPWLAIKFGCCASKEDVVDEVREGTRDIGRSEPNLMNTTC
jgi:hypothetical protein